MRARGLVDVLVPRGGAGLIRSVVEESTVPVIETGVGNCHVYVDAGGRPRQGPRRRAQRQDPAHQRVQRRRVAAGARGRWPTTFLPARGRGPPGGRRDGPRRRALRGVRRRGRRHRRRLGRRSTSRLDISAAVVPDLEAALAHIRRCSSRPHARRSSPTDQRGGAPLRRRGRLGGGAGQRLDPVHRRRRVRVRRRDRDQHPEAPRAGADGAARDDLDQVRRHRATATCADTAGASAGAR